MENFTFVRSDDDAVAAASATDDAGKNVFLLENPENVWHGNVFFNIIAPISGLDKNDVTVSENDADDNIDSVSFLAAAETSVTSYDLGDDDFISRLPKEMMVKILSYVSLGDLTKKVSLVSRLFRDRAYDPSLWFQLPKIFLEHQSDVNMYGALFERCTMLNKLQLGGEYNTWRDSIMLSAMALSSSSQLKELELNLHYFRGEEEVDITNLLEAIGSSASMKKLHLQGEWNPKTLSQGAEHLGRLTDLTIESEKGLDGEGLLEIGRHCKDLKHLEIPTNMALKAKDYILAFEGENLMNLTSLNLNDGLNDPAMSIIAENCPNLTSLKIKHCYDITDVGLESIATNCPNLAHLDVTGNDKITDAGLEAIATNCPNLAHLNISYCTKITDVGMEKILEGCRMLTELVLEGVGNVTSEAFRSAMPNGLRKLKINSYRSCIEKDEMAKIKNMLPELLLQDSRQEREVWSYETHGVRDENNWDKIYDRYDRYEEEKDYSSSSDHDGYHYYYEDEDGEHFV